MTRRQIIRLISIARFRLLATDPVWPGNATPDVRRAIKATALLREAGEVANAVLMCDRFRLENKLAEVAAVAVAWLESMEE